jgi:hypothetical protein
MPVACRQVFVLRQNFYKFWGPFDPQLELQCLTEVVGVDGI